MMNFIFIIFICVKLKNGNTPSVRKIHSFLLIELSNKSQSVTSIHHFPPGECFGCGLKIILVQKYIRIIYIDLIKCSFHI